ncbi:FxsA family protein [Azospirillum sp. sgz301742]
MNPLVLLLLLPILEIAVMIEVGGWIGAGPTLLLIVLSGIVGSLLLRHQGLATLRRAQESLDRGEPPVGAVFEGFCVVVGAILLIIPGFLTDIVGILLLVPFLRDALGRWLLDRMRASGSMRVWTNRTEAGPSGTARTTGEVIDVDYREVEPDAPRLEESRWGSDDRRKPDGRP